MYKSTGLENGHIRQRDQSGKKHECTGNSRWTLFQGTRAEPGSDLAAMEVSGNLSINFNGSDKRSGVRMCTVSLNLYQEVGEPGAREGSRQKFYCEAD